MSVPAASTAGSSLGHFPDGDRWAFDAGVTGVFDDMLQRSIPQYEVMRDLVFRVGARFVAPQTTILDLGCSRGEALDPFVRKFGAYNHYLGLEVSAPMLDQARARFRGYTDTKLVEIRAHDLREGVPRLNASLVLSVLTLMFTPINYRAQLIQGVYDTLLPGGGFILVEKLIGSTAALDGMIQDEYHAMKARNGYTQEEITRKKFALEGVQVPVTAAWNEDMLARAGFRKVECFWRWMNFAAWIGVK